MSAASSPRCPSARRSLVPSPTAAAADVRRPSTRADYPTVRATVVTPKPTARRPELTENGEPVDRPHAPPTSAATKSVVLARRPLAVDGRPGARGRVRGRPRSSSARSRPRPDRGRRVRQDEPSSSPASHDSTDRRRRGARTLEVDTVQGTALYDAIVVSTRRSPPRSTSAASSSCSPTATRSRARRPRARRSPPRRRRASPSTRSGSRARSFSPAPLQQLAEETGGRYYGAAATKALGEVYSSIAAGARAAPGSSSYVTVRAPGRAGSRSRQAGGHAESLVPGARHRASKPEASSAVGRSRARARPSFATIVGFLVPRSPSPSARAHRAAHWLQPPARPAPRRARSARARERRREERFDDRRRPLPGDGEGVRPLQAPGTRSTGCSSGPTCRCDGRARLRHASAPASLAGFCSRRPACRRCDHLRSRWSPAAASADLRRLAQGEAPAQRHRGPAARPPRHARRVAQGGAQLPPGHPERRRRGPAARERRSSSACSPRRGSAARWTRRSPTWPHRIGSKNFELRHHRRDDPAPGRRQPRRASSTWSPTPSATGSSSAARSRA